MSLTPLVASRTESKSMALIGSFVVAAGLVGPAPNATATAGMTDTAATRAGTPGSATHATVAQGTEVVVGHATPAGSPKAEFRLVMVDAQFTKPETTWTPRAGQTHRSKRVDLTRGFALIKTTQSSGLPHNATASARLVLHEAVVGRNAANPIGPMADIVIAEAPDGIRLTGLIAALKREGTTAEKIADARAGTSDSLGQAMAIIENGFAHASIGSRLRRLRRLLTYPFATSRGTSGGASSAVVGVWTRPAPNDPNLALVTYAVTGAARAGEPLAIAYRTAGGKAAALPAGMSPKVNQFVTLTMRKRGGGWEFVSATAPAAISTADQALRTHIATAQGVTTP